MSGAFEVDSAMIDPWPFDDPPNTAAFTTSSVLAGAPILLVTHDEDDGGFQFLPGDEVSESDARIVGLGTILKRHPSVAEVADLPEGWWAERDGPDKPWIRGARRRL
jgi:hypothetical protein